MRKTLAVVGSGLMLASVALIAGPAVAQDDDDFRGDRGDRGCTVELSQDRRTLTVEVDAARRARGHVARVEADFDTNRNRGDDTEWVRLNRRGNATVDFRIPRRADEVTVSVRIRNSRIDCEDVTLDLTPRIAVPV